MSQDIRALIPYVKDISVDLVAYYLKKVGWIGKEHSVYPVNVFSQDGQHEIVIPQRNDFKDKPYMVAVAVNFLSVFEGLDFNTMVSRIKSINRDSLRLRLFKNEEDIDSIPLSKAAQVIENMKTYLNYSACTEDDPKPFFQRATNVGSEFVDGCRFGHTFRGSFGLTIESPIQLPKEIQLSLIGEKPKAPFERRVMERVIRGVQTASSLSVEKNVELITENFRNGLNANMCEALSEVVQETDGLGLEYEVLWSPEWEVADDLVEVEALQVKAETTKILDSAASIMRDRKIEEQVSITGVISNLKSEFKIDEVGLDGYDRDVVIQPVVGEYKNRKVHVELSDEDYKKACNIHRDQKIIHIAGLIRKKGRSWTLVRYRDFRAVDV